MTRLDAAAFSPALGLHVGVALDGARLARLTLTRAAPEATGTEHPLLARVLRHLETGEDAFEDVPLALGVSAFDRDVLDAMRAVRPGEVVTYGELARRLGRGAGAARAIGGACSRNPVPVVVPCHRVVGADGALVHYSGEGGVATKRRLLEIERAWPPRARPRAAPAPRAERALF